ncbi:MAG: hypothetical protein M3P39_04805, partial [Actinomycetota bacterium]|nr:hypothetical protein [Actinomycetota bacterium]
MAHALELVLGEDVGEVEQRPGHRRQGKAVECDDVACAVERPASVHADGARRGAAPKRGDVDARGQRHEVPQGRGGRVAEDDGVRTAAGEDGRPQAPARGDMPVAEGVHAAMEPVQAARADAMVDRTSREAGGPQLTGGDDAVLAVPERCQRRWDENLTSHDRLLVPPGPGCRARGVRPRRAALSTQAPTPRVAKPATTITGGRRPRRERAAPATRKRLAAVVVEAAAAAIAAVVVELDVGRRGSGRSWRRGGG